MWYRIRKLVPRAIKAVLRESSYLTVVSDRRSLRAYRRSLEPERPYGEIESLAIRQLGHRSIEVRAGTTDANVVFATFFHRFHLPPSDLRMAPDPVIWDLGANIGLTMAHFAERYPRARVVGVELDGANVALCKRNVAPWSSRCTVVEGAVWHEDGQARYVAGPGIEDGYSVTTNGEALRDTAL